MHPSIKKTSETMKRRGVDNFRKWRELHAVEYLELQPSGDLAEYIGVVLGDGNIERFPRTERLTITGDFKKSQFILRYANFTEMLFGKKPKLEKALRSDGFRLSLYQRHISERLGVPTGNRKDFAYILPKWIEGSEEYLIRFLRGLFEAEGSLSIHLPTSTYNFEFTNYNKYLLDIVEKALYRLEFHPEVRHNAIRIRRKAEVERFKNLIRFRQY